MRGERRAIVAALREDACRKRVPEGIVVTAADATTDWMRRARTHSRRRAHDYFWTVVRRQAFSCSEHADLRRRFVIASMVADMRAVGISESLIEREVVASYGAESVALLTTAA